MLWSFLFSDLVASQELFISFVLLSVVGLYFSEKQWERYDSSNAT